MKNFHIEVPLTPDGIVVLFYRYNLKDYDPADFEIFKFSQAENVELNDFFLQLKTAFAGRFDEDYEKGNIRLNMEDVADATKICDELIRTQNEPPAVLSKLKMILTFAQDRLMPVHFFTDEFMQAIFKRNLS